MKNKKSNGKSRYDQLIEKAKSLNKSRKEKNLIKALEIVKEAEKLETPDPRLLSTKVRSLKYLGRLEEALEVARENYGTYKTSINLTIILKILSMLGRTDEKIEIDENDDSELKPKEERKNESEATCALLPNDAESNRSWFKANHHLKSAQK